MKIFGSAMSWRDDSRSSTNPITSRLSRSPNRIRLIAIEMSFHPVVPQELFVVSIEPRIEFIMRSDPKPSYCITVSFADSPVLVRSFARTKELRNRLILESQ